MYEWHKNIVTLAAKVLYEDMKIITYTTYENWCKRKKINRVRMGKGEGNYALVEFESLPEWIKEVVKKEYGLPPVETKSLLEKYIMPDYKAEAFFDRYRLDDGRILPPEIQKEYRTNAEVLNAISELIKNNKISRAKSERRRMNVDELWDKISKSVQELDKIKYPHNLPTSPQVLRKRKYAPYIKEGYSVLIHGNWSNQHRSKVKDKEQEAVLRQLLRHHNNLDNEQIAALYDLVAHEQNWDTISGNTVANYRKKWDLMTFAGRRGNQTFSNEKALTVKRRPPTYPLYYWTVDAWDVELLYQKNYINEKGKSVTTYTNRLNLTVVLDPCCKYPIGYAIGTHETPELTLRALRNAVQHTAELFGSKRRAQQIQADRYAIKKMTPFYEAVAAISTPARAHNAKAKVIESYFKYLNKTYCQMMNNWSGFGVTSNKANQPNGEMLNKIQKTFPDEEMCVLQIAKIIEMEREKKKAKYMSLYSDMPPEHREYMTNEEYYYHLGARTGYTNKISNDGLVVTLNGVKKSYDCFNPDFRLYGHIDWTVAYDPEHTGEILVYQQGGGVRFLLEQKYTQPMAIIEQTAEDRVELKKVRDFNKYLSGKIAEKAFQDAEIVEDLLTNKPELDTLSKLLLVDSNGQHKDQRNRAKIQAKTQKLLQKQEKKEEKQKTEDWQMRQEDYLRSKVDLNQYINEE
jgi:hypothetical protein